MYRISLACVALLGLALGCGDDSQDFPDGDSADGGGIVDECEEAQPCPLTQGQRAQALLAEEGDEDPWTFDVPAAGQVLNLVIGNDVNFSPVQLEAALFGPGGEAIVNRRSPSDRGPQRVEIQLLVETAGVHRLVVRDVGRDSADRLNPYYVEFSLLDDGDDNEPNETPAEATPLSFGSSETGVIATQGDLDWFSIDVTAGQLLEIRASAPGLGEVRHRWTLFAPDGTTRVAESSEPEADEAWPVEVRAVGGVAGRYLLLMEDDPGDGLQADETRIYQITVESRAQPDTQEGIEGNETPDRATPLTPGAAIQGYVASSADVDWYSFEVAGASEGSPRLVTAELSYPDASPVELQLTLLEPDGETLICERRDGDACRALRIARDGLLGPSRVATAHPVTSPGRYLISVRDLQGDAFDGDTPYTLTVQLPDEPDGRENYGDNSRDSAIVIGTSSAGSSIQYPPVTGVISYANDTDWYQFNIPGPPGGPGQNGDWLIRVEFTVNGPSPVEHNAFFFGPDGSRRERYRGFGQQCREPTGPEDLDFCQFPDAENEVNVDFQTSLDASSDDCFVVFREVTEVGPHYWRVSDLDRDDFDLGQSYTLRMSLTAGCPPQSACMGEFLQNGQDLCGRDFPP